MSVDTDTAATHRAPTRVRRAARLLYKALPAVGVSALISALLGWTASTQGLSPWSAAYLFVLILLSILAWQAARRALGGWTAIAVLSLGWAALTFLGAMSGALCAGQSCPASEVAAYTLTGALTPITAVVLISPLIALGWGGKFAYRRISTRLGSPVQGPTDTRPRSSQPSRARTQRKKARAASASSGRAAGHSRKRTRAHP